MTPNIKVKFSPRKIRQFERYTLESIPGCLVNSIQSLPLGDSEVNSNAKAISLCHPTECLSETRPEQKHRRCLVAYFYSLFKPILHLTLKIMDAGSVEINDSCIELKQLKIKKINTHIITKGFAENLSFLDKLKLIQIIGNEEF